MKISLSEKNLNLNNNTQVLKQKKRKETIKASYTFFKKSLSFPLIGKLLFSDTQKKIYTGKKRKDIIIFN